MHTVLPSMALALMTLAAASGCAQQSDAERLADVSREESPGTVDIGIPRQRPASLPLHD